LIYIEIRIAENVQVESQVNKDQSYGGLILVVSVLVLIGYLFALTSTQWAQLVVYTVVSIAVVGILGITGWIGWTMLTTPPPAPLEAELGTPSTSTTSGSSSTTVKPEEKH
jgi:hypothetical protein